MRKSVLIGIALALLAIQPAAAQPAPEPLDDVVHLADDVVSNVTESADRREVTYGPTQHSTGPSTMNHITCTITLWNLAGDASFTESDGDQNCSVTVTQRFSKHNWQRSRWWGWETIDWNEPGSNWFFRQFLGNTEFFTCAPGTFTYRAVAVGQFIDENSVTWTSPQVNSNSVVYNC